MRVIRFPVCNSRSKQFEHFNHHRHPSSFQLGTIPEADHNPLADDEDAVLRKNPDQTVRASPLRGMNRPSKRHYHPGISQKNPVTAGPRPLQVDCSKHFHCQGWGLGIRTDRTMRRLPCRPHRARREQCRTNPSPKVHRRFEVLPRNHHLVLPDVSTPNPALPNRLALEHLSRVRREVPTPESLLTEKNRTPWVLVRVPPVQENLLLHLLWGRHQNL